LLDESFRAVLNPDQSSETTGRFDHHPSVDELYDYVSMTLSKNDSEYVMRHIAFCPDCANEVWRIRELEEEFASDIEKPEKEKDKASNESEPKILAFPVKKKLSLKYDAIKFILPLAASIALLFVGVRFGLFGDMFDFKSAEKKLSEHSKIASAPKLSDQHQLMGAEEVDPSKTLSLDDQLIDAAGYGDNALVEKLLSEGANINAVDQAGMTPIAKASAKGKRTTVLILLRKGADKQIRDKAGKAAVDHALANGHESIANILRNSN
jgi:hypothetical protein